MELALSLLTTFISFLTLPPPSLATTSNPDCPSTCANIPTVSFPFGAQEGCGAPGFQLSNCRGEIALWNLTFGGIVWPNSWVHNIDNHHSYGTITLTSTDSLSPKCYMVPAYDPAAPTLYKGTNLSSFTPANLTFTSQDFYLLFNCSSPANLLTGSACEIFENDCLKNGSSSDSIPSCHQFQPVNEVNVSAILKKYECRGFRRFIIDSYDAADIGNTESWELGIQVYWNKVANDSTCYDCENARGTCGFNISDHSFLCYPRRGTCIGSLCSPISKVFGLGLPCGIAVAAIALVIVYLFRRRRKSSTANKSVQSNSSYSSNNKDLVHILADQVGTKLFTFKELLYATDSFSDDRMIGDGGFGAVYEGRLHDGRKVAVKRLYHDNCRRLEQFFNEIRILSSLRHANLVKLYGFCCEDERDLILVFEYVSNGTIADHLFGSNLKGFPWQIRLNVALETAEALSYLHNQVKPPIFHRDVKSTNILLDQNFHVKLADFGLSRLVPLEASHISTAPQGTPGYLDPDYHQCYQLTDKSDVYSFGVVLMELVSAKLAVDMSRDRREINLSNLAMTKIQCGALHELVDSSLEIDRYPDIGEMVKRVAELGFRCLAGEKDDRPTMQDVAEELADIKESGYGGRNPQSNIDILNSFDADEMSKLIKPTASFSPVSVQSKWPSSTT